MSGEGKMYGANLATKLTVTNCQHVRVAIMSEESDVDRPRQIEGMHHLFAQMPDGPRWTELHPLAFDDAAAINEVSLQEEINPI